MATAPLSSQRAPFTLVPAPRSLSYEGDGFSLPASGTIALPSPELMFEGQWIQAALATHGYTYRLTLEAESADIVLSLADDLPAEGYRMDIGPEGILITGAGAAGVFYGLCTLRQMLSSDPTLPGLTIQDAPDFPHRGYMLDISRDRVPTRATLLLLIDELASLKYNQLQLYIEHTFAYPGHEVVWRHADPLTPEDLLVLDAYCRQRHIELVPNQNSLGHVERWLKHPGYVNMGESPDGFLDHAGRHRGPSTLDPNDPASLTFISGLYDTLLPYFSSQQFNVGCDEPWELGQGKSKDMVEELGGRVYLDWLVKLHTNVTARGLKMMFWGDIILKYPQLVPELPKDVIVMEWGYESTHPFDANCAHYAKAGIPFYVCPGTSSWNALVGRADNAIGSIRTAVEAGLKHGATGVLVTDWGDNGHWQPYPASYVGIVYGGAASWCYESSLSLDMAAALDHAIYADAAGIMGRLTLGLANLYHHVGPDHVNGQVLAYMLQQPADALETHLAFMRDWGAADADVRPETLRRVITEIDSLLAELGNARMARPDAALLHDEWRQAALLLRHGAKWVLLILGEPDNSASDLLDELEGLLVQQRMAWLGRSRPGGLEDSMRRFEGLRSEYLALL
ncbi:MAG: family 20 glycosylhydrolase [Pleurocapsa minor GSE-CHR-MK-17-07R]|jgi:hypothetical protein|nr:family 20 glycosylhydrolase [Pleurocapsa minor GSE-CHR-MK 17-07R]